MGKWECVAAVAQTAGRAVTARTRSPAPDRATAIRCAASCNWHSERSCRRSYLVPAACKNSLQIEGVPIGLVVFKKVAAFGP